HPGDVRPWPRHAGCERAADHVVGEPDDRDSRGRALRGPDSRIAPYNDHVDGSRDEVGGQRGKAVVAPIRPHENVPDVAPVLPAERLHVLSESAGENVVNRLRAVTYYADHRHATLLRLDCYRRKKAESQNEPNHPHTHLGGERLARSLTDDCGSQELVALIKH